MTARSTRSVVIWTRANVPGFSLPSGFGTSPSIAKARDFRLTPGAMRTTLPANTCSGNASTLHGHLAPGLDPRRELLRHFGGELQRLQPHDPHDRRLRLDVLPRRDQPLGDVAVERRADHRVAQLALRKPQRRGLRLDVGAELPRRRERLVVRRLRGIETRLRRLEI